MKDLPYIIDLSLKRDKIENMESYPFSIPAIREFTSIKLGKEVTFFVGENGTGKSTLIEAIAVLLGFNAEGGTKNFNFSTRNSHSNLHEYLRLSKSYKKPKDGYFLRAESYFNVATNIEELDKEPSFGPKIINSYGSIPLHEQSHGESFLSLILHRFSGKGIYILDEPEAALSPTRQLALLRRMNHLISDSSQFIIATHSPILLAYPEAIIYEFNDKEISRIKYEDTEHYQITKAFLENPKKMLNELFKE
ncbi:AAA family ATPase [Pseudotamlana carrageenivorans]|uniref:AAA family ATPase n=1 Tax=Pseudotamlana carrageenivorans TaxID=2069432 RepID=A0A2I7SKW1_9FLAO|nr:AAA family ATPase [Tamlana carrageenivorans]AUS06510.1 AAA family ATPase [Tamlana carrageenivorans]